MTCPIVAAGGGMVLPAGLYLASQLGQPGERGWGIPMATDIAFVVGCLAVLGARVPQSWRIVLLSLAIADDMGAILVIAIGYTSHLDLTILFLGLLGLGAVEGLARLGVRSVPVYCIVGVLIWWTFHESGVHATIAGVLLGLLTPAQSWISWVSSVIMPLFALANAGVAINFSDFRAPVAVAVMVGLGVGKPIGIVSFSWLAVRLGIAKLPGGVTWRVLAAGSILAGIGFTMALFIASLALEDVLLNAAKVGILSVSALCAVIGSLLLFWLLPKPVSLTRRSA